MAAGEADERLKLPVLALPLFTFGVTEARGGGVPCLRPHPEPEAKVRDLGSPDSQPSTFAMRGLPGPRVRPGAFWKSLEC